MVNAAGLVVRGLAGAQCLWYLHGARGQLKSVDETPLPNRILNELHELSAKRREQMEESILKGPRFQPVYEEGDIVAYAPRPGQGIGTLDFVATDFNWDDGIVEERAVFCPPDGCPGYSDLRPLRMIEEMRTIKLGKWLRKMGASDFLLHEFETRPMPVWDFVVSADPLDVLTMTHGRPWERQSCMRPGRAYEYGPLTDMAAGSAVMFFYRPGAKRPSGRMILRPAADNEGHKSILAGRDIYGDGPLGLTEETLTDVLAEATGYEIPVQYWNACHYGDQGYALTRNIYSDVGRTGCRQSQAQYDRAYENLVDADWPAPQLEAPIYRGVATRFADVLPVQAGERLDLGAMAREAVNIAVRRLNIPLLMDILSHDLPAEASPFVGIEGMLETVLGEDRYYQLTPQQHNALAEQTDEDLYNAICAALTREYSHIFLFPRHENHPFMEYPWCNDAFDAMQSRSRNWPRSSMGSRLYAAFPISELGTRVDTLTVALLNILPSIPERAEASPVSRSEDWRRVWVDDVEVHSILVVPDFWLRSVYEVNKRGIGEGSVLHISVEPGEIRWC
jgi:hypothetical protein